MKRLSAFFIPFLTASLFGAMIPTNEAFDFNVYGLNADSEISASYLNTPITEQTRIKLSADGHLEANGQRVRIFGTNLSEFPRSREQAEKAALSLATQGYNCIRFHHTDASWSNCFLTRAPNGAMVMNQDRLDAFDYFFAQLKKYGIYSNINFLTGRSFSSADGYEREIDSIREGKAVHVLGMWNEEALKKQKEWASTLMNHYNPYTKTTYANDPAVAIVEINNENGLLMAYLNGWLDQYTNSSVYLQQLEDQWNEWLKGKNLSYEKLNSKYNNSSAESENLLAKSARWNMENHGTAKSLLSKNGNTHEIKVVSNGAENWHIQYTCSGFSIETSKIYTIRFKAKASKKSTINVSLMQAGSPWVNLGWSTNVELEPGYKTYSFVVSGLKAESNARLNFGGMGYLEGTTVYIEDIELKEGGNVTYVTKGRKSTSAKPTVHLPRIQEYRGLPAEYKNLVMTFLYEKEEAYWKDMYSFVRNELKSPALIMGTAMGCSSTYLQSYFDIIDTHAYWNHPAFPGSDWDTSQYYVKNRTLTKAGNDSTLTSLAQYRVYGKPFSVSEYDHPYPNQYSAEMYPMLASFASFQDWDCIFTFCSNLPDMSRSKPHISGYFDQSYNPSKSCAAPIAARIFRNNLVKSGSTNYYIPLSKETEKSLLHKNNAWSIGSISLYGGNKDFGKLHKIGIAINGKVPSKGVNLLTIDTKTPEKQIGFNDSKEMYIDETSGVYIINSENVSITIADNTAKLPEYPAEWKKDGRLLPVEGNNDFVSFAAVKEENKYLIFTCSWSGNKGEALQVYGTKEKAKGFAINRDEVPLTTLPNYGMGPAFALGIKGTVRLYGDSLYKLFKLPLSGNRTNEVTINKNYFDFNPGEKTLWWIIEKVN